MMTDEALSLDEVTWHDYAPVVAALFSALAPVAPPVGLRDRVLARVGPEKVTIHRGEAADWYTVAPGIETRELHRDDARGVHTFFMRLAPGATIPPHHHDAAEECYVVSGELQTFGTTLRAGDFVRAASGTRHGRSRSEGGCVLLLTSSVGAA